MEETIENKQIILAEKKQLTKDMDMFEKIIDKGYGEYKLYKFVTKDTEKMIVDISISLMDTIGKTTYIKGYEKQLLYKQISKKINDFKLETGSNFDGTEIAKKIINALGK